MINEVGGYSVVDPHEEPSAPDNGDQQIRVKAAIPCRLNAWAKKEARRKGVNTDIYLGELLIQALKEEQAKGRQETQQQLFDMLGPDWRTKITDLIDEP